jgi:hypothetical protein
MRLAVKVQASDAYVPAAQAEVVHGLHDVEPTVAWNLPEEQAVQTDAPAVSVNDPASHTTQYALDVW